ncbi:hypothetical protein [Spiroplasma endosymbiont of Diplazon laetatorius]|uniref:hypothetical protein n=1 Tax=Spiroplasma endosymbiont of Diplazon laetatorius TaxID=3066322 RepID=UPI0030CD947A
MIYILDISLKDEIKFSEELQDKEFIKVSRVDSEKMGLDAIFINEKYIFNKKEYYRLFIRPSISNADGYDYFRRFFQESKKDETTLNFKSGAIQLYIRTKEGVELIKNGKEEKFDIPSYKITGKRNGVFTLSDFDFIEVDIPASYIEDQQNLFISYSASYNVEGEYIKPHTNYGSIEIDRRNLTQHKYSNNRSTTTIANLAYGYFNYDFNNKYNRHYFDLLRNDIVIDVKRRSTNTIDPVMELRSNYTSWNSISDSVLGNKMNTFMKNYLEGLNRTTSLTSTPKLKSSFDYSDYYAIKKISDEVKVIEDKYEIKNKNITNYSFPKNTIEESELGTEGVLWNPLYNNEIIYNRELNLNSRLFSIDYVSEKLNKNNYNISYSSETENYTFSYLISYKTDELNNIGWKNKERIINYINEKEKNI